MARRPFFSGNYGSALGSYDTAAKLLAQAGQTQGAAMAGLGANIGGAIEKYQLNKEKRAKLTGDIEAYLMENPDYIHESTMTGDEATDKKNMTQFEKFASGDLNMAGLEGLAGKLARGDTLRKNKLLEESQRMQNEMQGLTLGIATKLEDTTVQLQKDKATISGINAAIAREANPQRLKLLKSQLAEAIANLGEGADERALRRKERGLVGKQIEAKESLLPVETDATRATLGAVRGQVDRQTESEELRLSGARRLEETAKALLDAYGGPEGEAAMTVEEKNLSMNKIQSYINYMDRQGQASVLKALVGTAPPSVTKQAATLSAFQGDLLGYKVRDPINGGMISFEKYLELNNSEGDSDYPLTGDNAGTAGRINATFLNSQKQIDDLVKTVEVQAVVPGAVDGTSASGLPSAIDPSMTPAQADAAKTARITEIRTLIDNLNTEFANLGAPGQTMIASPASAQPILAGPTGFAPGAPPVSIEQPQTLGHVSQRRQQIPAEIAALRAELTQLANL